MPKYEVKAPDGSIYDVNAPEGATEKDAIAYVQAQLSQPAQEKPAAVQAGSALNEIPRQVGLTARYGIEGLGNTAQIFTEPLRMLQDKVLGTKSDTAGHLATRFADWVGLPTPQSANERVVGDAARLMAGSAGIFGPAQAAAGKVGGVAGEVLKSIAAKPVSQLTASAGGGLAGGASREAGGSPLAQAGATLLGTVAGGVAPDAVMGVGRRVQAMLPQQASKIEGKISLALKEVGVDWESVPASIRAQVVGDASKAMRTGGDLNADALRRLTDFRLTNTTPTRGMLTLDPVQITREQNLAKIGANAGDDGLHGLAQLQNRNNSQLIRNLNSLGAGQGDEFAAGASSINRIAGQDAAMKQRVTGMYDAARNMPGGEIPVHRAELINNIYDRLAKENKMAFLPQEVASMLDEISLGQVKRGGKAFDVPFDAKALDNLMTTVATAQRGTKDGNVKAALNLVRQAIDDTPLQPVKTEFGGNRMVTQAGADFLRKQDAQAGDYMGALNKAREAHRQRMSWQESAKPIQAALDGMEPDKYVQKFVIGGTLKDAETVANIGDKGAVRDALLAHMKGRALNNASDEVGKFSQSAFNKALDGIGERKLALFFSKDELTQLKANARAASYMQVQPVGAAVNNSNSGALVLGRGYDWLNAVASKFPMGKQLVVDPVRSIDISLAQRGAENYIPGLLTPLPKQRPSIYFGPATAMGGLLAAPAIDRP